MATSSISKNKITQKIMKMIRNFMKMEEVIFETYHIESISSNGLNNILESMAPKKEIAITPENRIGNNKSKKEVTAILDITTSKRMKRICPFSTNFLTFSPHSFPSIPSFSIKRSRKKLHAAMLLIIMNNLKEMPRDSSVMKKYNDKPHY